MYTFLKAPLFSRGFMTTLVRHCIKLNHMLHVSCRSSPISWVHSWCIRYTIAWVDMHNAYPSFIIRTTRVSIPIWSLTFISQCQCTMPNIYHLVDDVLFYFYAFHQSIAQWLILVCRVEPWDLNLKSYLQAHYAPSSQMHLHPLSCCDCWHRVIRCLSSNIINASSREEVHDLWAFYLHMTFLWQTFAYCRTSFIVASYMSQF